MVQIFFLFRFQCIQSMELFNTEQVFVNKSKFKFKLKTQVKPKLQCQWKSDISVKPSRVKVVWHFPPFNNIEYSFGCIIRRWIWSQIEMTESTCMSHLCACVCIQIEKNVCEVGRHLGDAELSYLLRSRTEYVILY